MPMYEYRCSHCSEHFERWLSFNDPTPECPQCGEAEVTKLISGFRSGGNSAPAGARPARSSGFS